MKGIARVYDRVTPEMRQQVLDALEARWAGSLAALLPAERERLESWFPNLRQTQATEEPTRNRRTILKQHKALLPARGNRASDLR